MAQAKSPLPNSFSLEWSVNLEPSGEQNGLPNFKQADVVVANHKFKLKIRNKKWYSVLSYLLLT